mgnify:CR=1 FL=1
MEDKEIINFLLIKVQKLNQVILQQELNVAGKEIELATANKKIEEYVSNITNGEDNVYPEEEQTN